MAELRRDVSNYHRRLKLLNYIDFTGGSKSGLFAEPSNWEPNWDRLAGPVKETIEGDLRALKKIPGRRRGMGGDNLTAEERGALAGLRGNPDLVLKPADKGSKIVIQDKAQYSTEALRQLQNTRHYVPLTKSIQLETQANIREVVRDLYNSKYISAKQRAYLSGSDSPRVRKFYLLSEDS